jgi:hypothetical protein
MNLATARRFCFLEQRKNGVSVSTILTYAPPFISVPLTFHCIAILIGAGAYDDASDEDSCDGDMCLSDYIKQETKESTAALFLGIAKTFEQFQIDNRNKHIVVWLDQVTPAHLLQPMAC